MRAESGYAYIEFESKSEKWMFIKENLPDFAVFISDFTKEIKIEPPLLKVRLDWLLKLEGVQLEEQYSNNLTDFRPGIR